MARAERKAGACRLKIVTEKSAPTTDKQFRERELPKQKEHKTDNTDEHKVTFREVFWEKYNEGRKQ